MHYVSYFEGKQIEFLGNGLILHPIFRTMELSESLEKNLLTGLKLFEELRLADYSFAREEIQNGIKVSSIDDRYNFFMEERLNNGGKYMVHWSLTPITKKGELPQSIAYANGSLSMLISPETKSGKRLAEIVKKIGLLESAAL